MDNATLSQTENKAVDIPRDFLIGALQGELLKHGAEAQKGSQIGADRLLDLMVDLKSDPPLLKDVLDGLHKENYAKVKNGQNGSPKELVFDQNLPGYPKSVVRVDIDLQTLNGKSEKQWDQGAIKERQEFVNARIDASNRPLPENFSKPMNKQEREMTRSVEQSLIAGDLSSIVKKFQADPGNKALWTRVAAEVESDFPESSLKYGTAPDGKPYLGIRGSTIEYSEIDDFAIIPAKGGSFSIEMDDHGEPDFKRTISRTPSEVLASQTASRVDHADQRSYDYRCDFDHQERRKAAGIPVRTVVEKYNTYKTHYCGDEAID